MVSISFRSSCRKTWCGKVRAARYFSVSDRCSAALLNTVPTVKETKCPSKLVWLTLATLCHLQQLTGDRAEKMTGALCLWTSTVSVSESAWKWKRISVLSPSSSHTEDAQFSPAQLQVRLFMTYRKCVRSAHALVFGTNSKQPMFLIISSSLIHMRDVDSK